MRVGMWAIICGCVAVAVACIIVGNFMFDMRAAGLVFAAIMATIGMFEGIIELEKLEDGEENSDDE